MIKKIKKILYSRMGISGQMWLPNLDTILECDQNFEKGSNGGHGALTPSVFSESRPQSIISENSILELSDSEDETLIRIESIDDFFIYIFYIIY